MRSVEPKHKLVPDSYHIVTLHRGVDKEEFIKELSADGIGVIRRHVDCPDMQRKSRRNITVDIDFNERMELLQDPRIDDVQPVNYVEQIRFFPTAIQTINPAFTASNNPAHNNWALDFCTDRTGNSYTYSHTGKGVDIVIVDSGVHPDHAEFKDKDGLPRLQQIEWEPNQFVSRSMQYVDEGGHGTAVASSAAGITQGFARDARIYSIKIFDTDAYTPLQALQNVRDWHLSKVGTPDEGRPTIVNNSWTYSRDYPANHPTKANMPHGVRVASVDAEIATMIDDGIIVVCAAGNENHYVAATYDPKYNEYYYVDNNGNWTDDATLAAYAQYTNRLTPSGADTALCIGANGDHYPDTRFGRAWYSNFGSRIDLFAPGTAIQTALTNTVNSFEKINGTSFSSPIVAGIIAQYMETYKTGDQGHIKSFLDRHGDRDIITDVPTSTNNLSVISIFNGLRLKVNNGWKPIAYALEKRNGMWSRTKNIPIKDSGTVKALFGRLR
jgi:subtilisin family serine protease